MAHKAHPLPPTVLEATIYVVLIIMDMALGHIQAVGDACSTSSTTYQIATTPLL
jgi:hypothetical protein